MIRAAHRLLALAALTGGGAAPFPTLANDNVFDSQREDLDVTEGADRAPYIVIRSDDDTQGLSVMGDTTSRKLLLRLEIGVMQGYRDTGGNLIMEWPRSDSGIEIFLDLFEWQIQAALIGNTPWALRFRNRFTPVMVESVPMFTNVDEVAVRIAARELAFTFEGVAADPFPPPLRDGDPAYEPQLPATLVEVFDLIDRYGHGDVKDTSARLRQLLEAQNLPKAGVYPLLTSLIGSLSMADRTAPPTGELDVPQIEAELYKPGG